MELIYRPLHDATWPGALLHPDERRASRFTSDWRDTVALLDREVDLLANGGDHDTRAVLEVPFPANRIYSDGRGVHRDAAAPRHPGVALSFDSDTAGPLRFATDVFAQGSYGKFIGGWKANVRAIAMGLEALRMVDRYGITRAGEQYRGWSALGTGEATPLGAGTLTREEAARILADAAGWKVSALLDPEAPDLAIKAAYRDAARDLHPDAGGPADGEAWALVTKARDTLLG